MRPEILAPAGSMEAMKAAVHAGADAVYLGGEKFAGEEAVWLNEKPVWCMNYAGRVLGENFSGDFLKEALYHVPEDMPYRGPAIYTKGDYHYHCKVDGEFVWFQGYEEIFYMDEKIYECYFHGGTIR